MRTGKNATLRIVLIRHGCTRFNLQKKYSGSTDVPLSKRGIMDVKKARRHLAGEKIDVIYCSDLRRAIQTCKIIFPKKEFKKTRGLREIDFGIFEGLTHRQITRKYPKIYSAWLKDPFKVKVPRAESFADFQKRVNSAFKEIIEASSKKTAAIVCHGGTISVFINSILKKKDFWGHIPKSAGIIIIEYKKGKLFSISRR